MANPIGSINTYEYDDRMPCTAIPRDEKTICGYCRLKVISVFSQLHYVCGNNQFCSESCLKRHIKLVHDGDPSLFLRSLYFNREI